MEQAIKKFAAFEAGDNTFTWHGHIYRHDRIVHLTLRRAVITQRLNFVKVGEPERAELHIDIGGSVILLSVDERTFIMGFNRDKKKPIADLLDLYVLLAKKTFNKRLKFYSDQMQDNGFFAYDECRFFPDRIMFRTKEFSISSSVLLKGPGWVELRRKDRSILENVVRSMTFGKIPQFNTSTDTDVIFYLIHKLYNLQWTN